MDRISDTWHINVDHIQNVCKLTCTDSINRVYDEWKADVKEETVRVAK